MDFAEKDGLLVYSLYFPNDDESFLIMKHEKRRKRVLEKSILRKKRVESKLRRKYVLNLLNEPQNLAEIKTPKLLKILNQRIKNLRQRKLKHNLLKLRENKQEKYAKKMSTSETLQLARSITKFIWYASCIQLGSAVSIASCLEIE